MWCESELWLTLPIIIMHITEWIKATSGSWANFWHCFKCSRFWTSLRQHSRIEYMPQKPKWPSYAIGSHRQRQPATTTQLDHCIAIKKRSIFRARMYGLKRKFHSLPPVQSVVHLIFHMLGNCVLYCFFAVVFIQKPFHHYPDFAINRIKWQITHKKTLFFFQRCFFFHLA